jgi:hypothetical protein
MAQENNESTKKAYRAVQIEGKITWRIEELWDGGVIRQPYGSRHAAIKAEERIAQENGFIDVLTLQEVLGEEAMPADAFEKHADGSWRCLKACAIDIDNTRIVLTAGTEFEKGILHMGHDIAGWLDKNYASHQRI